MCVYPRCIFYSYWIFIVRSLLKLSCDKISFDIRFDLFWNSDSHFEIFYDFNCDLIEIHIMYPLTIFYFNVRLFHIVHSSCSLFNEKFFKFIYFICYSCWSIWLKLLFRCVRLGRSRYEIECFQNLNFKLWWTRLIWVFTH